MSLTYNKRTPILCYFTRQYWFRKDIECREEYTTLTVSIGYDMKINKSNIGTMACNRYEHKELNIRTNKTVLLFRKNYNEKWKK